MSKVAMPQPAFQAGTKIGNHVSFVSNDPAVKKMEGLFTKSQLEAYAAAKVREALEEAAEVADRHNEFATYDAIRALIPKEST